MAHKSLTPPPPTLLPKGPHSEEGTTSCIKGNCLNRCCQKGELTCWTISCHRAALALTLSFKLVHILRTFVLCILLLCWHCMLSMPKHLQIHPHHTDPMLSVILSGNQDSHLPSRSTLAMGKIIMIKKRPKGVSSQPSSWCLLTITPGHWAPQALTLPLPALPSTPVFFSNVDAGDHV